jgi:hypothetical protein
MKKLLIVLLLMSLMTVANDCSSDSDCTPPNKCLYAGRSRKKVCTIPQQSSNWDN